MDRERGSGQMHCFVFVPAAMTVSVIAVVSLESMSLYPGRFCSSNDKDIFRSVIHLIKLLFVSNSQEKATVPRAIQ